MSPVHIPRGFTKAFIAATWWTTCRARIGQPTRRVAGDRDVAADRGHRPRRGRLGHRPLERRCGGDPRSARGDRQRGRRRPADRRDRAQPRAVRAARRRVLGAIVNKVDADAAPDAARHPAPGLARHGIPLLGTLPYRPMLSIRRSRCSWSRCRARSSTRATTSDRVIEHVAIGAMQPRHVLERIGPGRLLIVPGRPRGRHPRDHRRRPSQRACRGVASSSVARPSRFGRRLGRTPSSPASLFTGGYRPGRGSWRRSGSRACSHTSSRQDTYQAASTVHDLLVKTHPRPRPRSPRSGAGRRALDVGQACWTGSTACATGRATRPSPVPTAAEAAIHRVAGLRRVAPTAQRLT